MTLPLTARAEALAGGDREVDLEIGLSLGGWTRETDRDFGGDYLLADDVWYPWPPKPGQMWPSFTESLDATLALTERVRPGARFEIGIGLESGEPFAHFKDEDTAYGATIVLALLAALLRSLEADEPGS